ncbi:MAG: hypothetical protein ACOCXJ_02660, partial [Planctomycetota bacterium]
MPDPIRRLQARMRLLVLLRGLLLLSALTLGALLAVILLDAVWILSPAARAALPAWGLGALLVALVLLGLALMRWRPRRLAVWCQGRRPGLGSSLSNAVELEGRVHSDPVTEHLRLAAVAQGRQAAAGLALLPLLRRSLLSVGSGCVLVLLAGLVLRVAAPELLNAVWPRLIDPAGDHPPWSRSRISVQSAAEAVVYGGQLEITARVAGEPIERLELVATGADGRSSSLMFRRPDRSFVQTLTNIRHPLEIHVTDGRSRSLRQRIAVLYRPRIESVRLHCRFPAYTGLSERLVELADQAGETLRLPRGTSITCAVTSNRPLVGGSLLCTPVLGGEEQALALQPDAQRPQLVEARLHLDEAVVLGIDLEDVDGLHSDAGRQVRIDLLPDRPPRVQVLEPAGRAVATPDARIPVQIQAEDDYGIAGVAWFRGLNDSLERRAELAFQSQRDGRQATVAAAFDLADLGLRPGDRISWFVEAIDNDPHGPQLATTPNHSLEIISQEDYRAIQRQRAAQQELFGIHQILDRSLARLGERLQAAQDLDPEQRRSELGRIAAELEQLGASIQEQLARPELADLEAVLRPALEQQLADLQQAAAAARDLSLDLAPDAQQLASLRATLDRQAEQAQRRIGDPTRHLASVARVLAAAQTFTALAQEQAELAAQSRRFLGSDSGERHRRMALQEVAERQRANAAALQTWSDHVRQLLAAVPADAAYDPLRASTEGFLVAVASSDIADLQQSATLAFQQRDGSSGHGSARQAAERMLALLAQVEPLQGIG